MAKASTYEYVYDDTYPAGTTEARLIDDIFRAEKEALYNRMDQEHYWRRINDTEYEWEFEGSHRPESARVWNIDWTPGSTIAPEFPDADANIDKALFAITGEITEDDDTGNQWFGTLWFADGEDLVPAIRRIRGKLRINGAAFFSKENLRFDGTPAGAFTVNEGIPERGSNTATIAGNNITLVPFHALDDTEWGDEEFDTPEGSKTSIVYPIRVGNYRPTDGDYTAPDESVGTEGMALIVGNYPSGDGVAYVFTRRGIEVFTSGADSDTEDITFNGISLRKHDHSGDKMGASVSSAVVDPTDEANRYAWFKELKASNPQAILAFPLYTNWEDEIEGGEGDLYPTGEGDKLTLYPVQITFDTAINCEATHGNSLFFRLAYQNVNAGPWTTLRMSTVSLAPYTATVSQNLTVTWLFSPGEIPANVYRMKVQGSRGTVSGTFTPSGTVYFSMKVMGWRR